MATHTGSEGVIKSGANTVAEVRSYTVSETGDTIEDTSMGDASRTYKAGLKTWTASVEAMWDETDTTGQGSFDVGASVTLNVYPEGSTTGDIYYTGSAIVTGKTVNATFDGMVEASFTLQGTGALSESTV
jgi:predicted secreted protein